MTSFRYSTTLLPSTVAGKYYFLPLFLVRRGGGPDKPLPTSTPHEPFQTTAHRVATHTGPAQHYGALTQQVTQLEKLKKGGEGVREKGIDMQPEKGGENRTDKGKKVPAATALQK